MFAARKVVRQKASSIRSRDGYWCSDRRSLFKVGLGKVARTRAPIAEIGAGLPPTNGLDPIYDLY